MWRWQIAAASIRSRSLRPSPSAVSVAAMAVAAVFGSQSLVVSDREHDDVADNDQLYSSSSTYLIQHSQCQCEATGPMILPSNHSLSYTNNDKSDDDGTHQPSRPQQPREAKLAHRPSNNINGGSNFCLSDAYDVDEVLGEGTYGLVYKARRKSDGLPVAVKTMPRSLTGKTDFEREVAALQLLSKPPGHDHVVKFYDLHRDDMNYYLVMELVEGGELLDSLISVGAYSEAVAATFIRQFAEALSYVHTQGLTHADLKPENLLLTPTNQLKLADFGCAKSHDMSRKDMQLPAHEFAMGCSFLHMVALGNVFELEKMLQERPHLVTFRDYDFRTALHLAASEGHVDICRYLVEKGAKVSPSDRWGGSPLDDAHRHRHIEVIDYLREQGATFGTKTQLPRFIQAASDGDVREVTALLEFGSVDLDAGDYDGRTALHLASGEGRVEIVKLLCEAGADVNVADRWANRPLDDASKSRKNSAAVMSILTEYGAKSTQNPSLGSQIMATDTDTAKDVSAMVRRTKKKDIEGPSGTIAYNPPEMLVEGGTPTPQSDMWAAGVIMYVILTGTHPFDPKAELEDMEIRDVILSVTKDRENQFNVLNELVFDERVEDLSESCVDLMRKLIHPDPESRLSADRFLQHPWTQGLTASWTTMGKTHTELKAFWQNRFRTEIEKAFGAKVGKEPGEALSQGDLQEIFGALDLKKNGVLDLEEIQTTFRKLGFNDKNIETLFKSADLDGSGCISFNEFRELLTTKNNNGQNDLQVEYLLKKFRTHIFDRLEQAGFERGSVDSEKLWRMFNELDVGHHGVLDLHDIRVALRRAGESEDVITKMLAALDVKHEGKISWDDFQQIMFETRKIQGQY